MSKATSVCSQTASIFKDYTGRNLKKKNARPPPTSPSLSLSLINKHTDILFSCQI